MEVVLLSVLKLCLCSKRRSDPRKWAVGPSPWAGLDRLSLKPGPKAHVACA